MRAIIVDVADPAPSHEVLLTPAHGLPADVAEIRRDCYVTGPQGTTFGITRAWLSPERDKSHAGDWAVLTTDRAFGQEVTRRVVAELPQSVAAAHEPDEVPISLMLYSQGVDKNCRLLAGENEVSERAGSELLFYSCRTWRGLSGAPILVAIDGDPVVVGFHLATVQLQTGAAESGARSIARAVDTTIVAAILQAAEGMK